MSVRFLQGDCRDVLPTLDADSFDCVVTSPPYWGLRDYGVAGQIGLEPTLQDYLDTMVSVCCEVRRVMKPEGTFWLNIGDCYAQGLGSARGKPYTRHSPVKSGLWAGTRSEKRDIGNNGQLLTSQGLKPKDLCMVPNRLALALQADGWWVRSEIIWAKKNCMPESVTDRPTSSHEKIWLLTKSERYYFDADAIKEEAISDHKSGNGYSRPEQKSRDGRGSSEGWNDIGGSRNSRNVWTIASQPFKGAHFATFPPELAERCIKAGSRPGGHILDPFGGAGTVGLVADRLGRNATLIELNPAYRDMAQARVTADAPLFAETIA